jgi:hypothetical protein
MHSFSLLLAGAFAVQPILALPGSVTHVSDISKRSVDTFLASESPIALANAILAPLAHVRRVLDLVWSWLVLPRPPLIVRSLHPWFVSATHTYDRLLHVDSRLCFDF